MTARRDPTAQVEGCGTAPSLGMWGRGSIALGTLIRLLDRGEDDLGVGWPNIVNNISVHTEHLSGAGLDSRCFRGDVSSLNLAKPHEEGAVITSVLSMKNRHTEITSQVQSHPAGGR